MVNSCLTTIWKNAAKHRFMSMFTSKFEMILLLDVLRRGSICRLSVPLPVIWESASLLSRMHIASYLPRVIFAQSRGVATTLAGFRMHRFWLRLRRASTEMPPLRVPARMMSTDRSSDSMHFLLPLWRRRGFGKAHYGRRWHPKMSAKSFRPHRRRAPLGCDAQLLTICVGRGA